MANLNKVLLIGRLTRDPEFKYIPSGAAVAEFGLAVNRHYVVNGERREDTCFVDVNIWGRRAETVRDYLRKGQQVFIEGHLVYDQWQTQDGQKRSKLRITADNFQFMESSNRKEGGGYQQQGNESLNSESQGQPPSQPFQSGGMQDNMSGGDDSGVPF